MRRDAAGRGGTLVFFCFWVFLFRRFCVCFLFPWVHHEAFFGVLLVFCFLGCITKLFWAFCWFFVSLGESRSFFWLLVCFLCCLCCFPVLRGAARHIGENFLPERLGTRRHAWQGRVFKFSFKLRDMSSPSQHVLLIAAKTLVLRLRSCGYFSSAAYGASL